jgi:hypothetical protein
LWWHDGLRGGIVENTIPQQSRKNQTNMTSTRTIDALLDLMQDADIVTHLRIDAAEQLLGFEALEPAVIRAREFLIEIFENKEESISDRMEALKIARKSESAKVTPKIVRLEVKDRGERERREEWRHYETVQLRLKLFKALPVGTPFPSGWADHLTGDDYVPPPGDEWPPWCKKA